ncbi:MAG: Gfo/Idh/MocA family oxidoreductase [SAR202 cluster bacterium]|nr:Gfo/Idh/MocA family oxidoreductase [SAR202 cluster bacterium]
MRPHGHCHARAYNENPQTRVVAAADRDEKTLEQFCRRFNVPGYTDYQEMLGKEKIDIVAPVLPVKVNPDVVVGAARLGVKAVFCEKPIAAVLSDADRMVEECRKHNVVFQCGDAYRALPQYWQAKAIIDSGELGPVQSVVMHEPTIEISGGGCQGLSLMRLDAGDSEIDWVTGWVGGDPWSNEDQNMGGVIRFSNGVEGYVMPKATARRGIEVHCARGLFFADWRTFKLFKLRDGVQAGRAFWEDLEEMPGALPESGAYDTSYDSDGWRVTGPRTTASIESLVDALETGVEPRSSGDNQRRVLEIAIAFRESHRRGHAPVKLPLEDRSLALYPHPTRWNNKKDVYGSEKYDSTFEVIKRTK